MKHTRMGKTLRTFSLAVAGVCALAALLLFASCENMGGDAASYDALLLAAAGQNGASNSAGGNGPSGGQTAGGQATVEGALTASVRLPGLPSLAGIAPLSENAARYAGLPTAPASNDSAQASDGISKSAFPNIADATGTAYSFSATLSQSGTGGATYSADGTYNSVTGTCSFSFGGAKSASEQSYTLTVELYHASGTPAVKSLVASGSQSVTVGADAPSFSASVSLLPNLESGAPNGSLKLPIKFSDTSVTSVQLTLLDSGNHDVTASYLDCGTSLTLTGGSGTIESVAGGLPAGTYTLLMSFMKGTAQVGARTESLNVYPAMETSLWWTKDGIDAAATALSVTQFNQKEFYVRGTGGVFYTTVFPTAAEAEDTNIGSFAFPLKTIQEAVDRINDAGDTTTQYTVYIDGKVTGDPDSNDSSLAYINKARKILFKGWTGPDTDIIDVNKNWESSPLYPTRAFYIYAAATITAQNLGITNASSGTSSDGGAIGFNAAANGAVVTLENCKISGCGAQNGGAISVYNGTLNLKQCSVYHNNATRDGGGIYVDGQAASTTILVTIEDSQIYDNTATATSYGNGGGIYVKTNARVNFKSGVIGSDDTTKGNKCKNGGGVDVASGGIFEMSGSARIVGNSASNNGGGIYVAGGQAIFSSGIIGSDDPSKGNTAKNGGGVWVSSSGKFSMSGSSRVSGNSATTYGGGIYSEGESLMGGSSQVCGNTANYGGGVYISAGCFCMSGSAIVGAAPTGLTEAAQADDAKHSNKATNDGGGIFTYTPSRLKLGYVNETTPDPTFSGGIYYNYANNGGGIYASGTASTAIIEMGRGSVCYNGAAGEGGGICTYSLSYDAPFKMTGGEVSNNSAASGGGIYAKAVYVGGGTIAGNTASNYGGGVYASSDFYLYGSGVIGDMSKAEIAKEDDCSNKAKAGGGVYGHKVYIGYSDASTSANCTGGIYRNYATAVKGSETYFNGGGGICIRGTSAYWLFKMQSGTVAYNAGDSSDGYGGGLFIYGSGAPDSSITYPEATGGSFVGNGAKYGGALCYYTGSFAVGGSVYMPSATGEKGDNDIYIDNDICCLHLASDFDAATPTPVLTATPSTYSPGKKIFDGTIGDECEKIGIASNTAGWAVKNDGTLYKDCSELYVSASGGDDTAHDGSVDKPYATISYAASKFSQPERPVGGTEYAPLFKNKIYIISDMRFTAGAGATGDYNFEVIGRLGGPAGDVGGKPVPVTLTFDTSGSGFYVPTGQNIKFTNINITQSSGLNDYAAILADGGTFYMEDCSIKGMATKDCSAIAADGTNAGKIYLKNVEISGNKVEQPNISGAAPWGPAVSVKSGTLAILGKVVIGGNTMKISDGAGGYVYKEQNVWIGDNPYPHPAVFHPIVVAGPLADGSQIGVTTYDPSATVFTSGYTSAGNTAAPKTYFTSDAGMAVALTTSAPVGEAVLAVPTDLHVSGPDVSPAGSDVTGNGSAAKPYASVAQAIMTLDGYGVAANEYTIHVSGTITENVNVPDGIAAAKITIAGTSAATDILDGVDKSGAVVTIDESAIPVDLKNLTITNGSRGVDIEAAATVNIEGCVITGNQGSVSGAGVYMGAGGSLTITDTDITQNIATGSGSGGGIYVPYSGSLAKFEMTGGSLSNNSAKNGGGASLACIQAANPLLKNVTISGNTATANGGGVYVTSGRYLTIEGCDISGNTATSGGGIYNAGGCNIKGSTTISANTATSGGAICAAASVTLGGGVYIPAGTAGANDVYLAAGALINVASELTATPTPVATITPIVYNNITPVVALASGSTATLDDSIAKFAVTPNSLSSWTIVKDALGITGVLRATNSASGGISISISEGVAFVVAVPKKSGDAASFVVQDTSGASPVAIAADDPYIAIKQNGATVYSANAQSVGAPFLSPGSYQLYCRATVEGLTYDTTTPFEVGDKYTPLTLEAREAGAVVTFSNKAAGPVYYSVNKGTRQEIASGASEDITLAAVGDMVQFYGDNAAYGGPTSTASDSSNISCSKACYVYGNIMSLIKSSGFESETKLTASNTFKNLFRDNSNIYNKTGQSLLLPATTLAISCYNTMFQGCTSLTNAPELPATTLTNMCYYLMFQGCTSLTSAPALPATTLAGSCYYLMFQGCTSLTSAPALPATTLAAYCYFSMFQGCTSLNSVTCLATDISATNCTTNWLSGVAATGTFTKAPGMTAWTSGASGIPSGWTTQDAP